MNVLNYRSDGRVRSPWLRPKRLLLLLFTGFFLLAVLGGIITSIETSRDISRTKQDLEKYMKQLPPGASSAQVFAMFRQRGIGIDTDADQRPLGGYVDKGSHLIFVRIAFDSNDHLTGWWLVDGWRGP